VAGRLLAKLLDSEAGQLYSFVAADHQQSCHPLPYSGQHVSLFSEPAVC